MSNGSVRAAVALLLAVALIATAVPAGVAGSAQVAGSQTGPFQQEGVDADAVVMDVTLAEDGTAAWTVEFRVRLDDENATTAFDSVQADIEENASAFTEQFATGMERTVRSAENRTGRGMALENVTVGAERRSLPQEYGVITYEFRWTDFATADGDRLSAGDALSGLFLDEESKLIVRWPDGYGLQSVAPDPTESYDDRVVWEGAVDFATDEPRVVVAPTGPLSGGSLPLLAGGGLVLLAVALAAGWLVSRRTGLLGDAVGGAVGAASGDGGDGDDGPPEELLSNEERVLRLLNDRGGRVKQQEIAGEFDWTDAKTSQVVGKLRDEDAVETFRIGRENVVALPEESDL